jgi:hypothetical protein
MVVGFHGSPDRALTVYGWRPRVLSLRLGPRAVSSNEVYPVSA